MKKTMLFMFIAAVIFGVIGCQQAGQLPEILKITDRSPALNATNLSGTETLSASFNFQIYHTINYLLSQESITIDNLFTEILGYGPNHTGGDPDLSSAVLSWSQDSKTMIISGIDGWTGGASKVIEIVPRGGKLVDVFGNALKTSTVVWKFTLSAHPVTPSTTSTTTTTSGDTNPPSVSSVLPNNGATNLDRIGVSITAEFDEAMDASTINSSTFNVTSPTGPVSGSLYYNAANKTAVFTPDYFSYGVTYVVTISASVADLAGNPMGSAYTWSFTSKDITFQSEIVDSAGDVGPSSSIAIGSVHISYYDVSGSSLKYVNGTFGSWFSSQFVDTGDLGASSLALDSSGKSHISYQDEFNKKLKYATNSSGSWQQEMISDPSSNYGFDNSLAVDSSDIIHIAYKDSDNTSLRYTTGNYGSWASGITIDDGGIPNDNVGSYPNILIGQGDILYLCYFDSTNQDIKYTKKSSGSWDAPAYVGETSGHNLNNITAALDQNDKFHISYGDKTDGTKYATNVSGGWVIELIDSGEVWQGNSIAVDKNGAVHISYPDGTSGNLKYATNATSSWQILIVDNSGNVGSSTSIAIDPDGKINISYYDSTNDDLRYAISQ